MGLITPDLSEATKTLEPGVYPARVVAVEPAQSKAGKQMVKWKFETFDMEDNAYNGRTIVTRTMAEGRGVFKLQEAYKAATGHNLEGAFDPEQLVGAEVRLTLVDSFNQDGSKSDWPEVKSIASYN